MNKRNISILTGAAVTALFLLLGYAVNSKKPNRYTAEYNVKISPRAGVQLQETDMMTMARKTILARTHSASVDIDIMPDRMMKVRFTDVKDTTDLKGILTFGETTVEFVELHSVMDMLPVLKKLAGYEHPATKVTNQTYRTETGITVVPVEKEVEPEETGSPDLADGKEFVDTSEVAPGLRRYVVKEKAKDTISGIEVPKYYPPQMYNTAQGDLRYPATIGYIYVKDSALFTKLLHDTAITSIVPYGTRFCYGKPELNDQMAIYAISTKGRDKAVLGNEDIKDAYNESSAHGDAQIQLQFNSTGAMKWKNMTQDNVGKPLAIIINNVVVSAPYVNEPIENGSSVINGGFSFTESENLANQLKSGTLPVELDILEQKISKQNVMLSLRFLLFPIVAGIIAGAVTWVVFKSLKTS